MKKILILSAFIAALVPALFTLNLVGGLSHWEGVLPKGSSDSLYYYARIHEVADGHPLVGNPYAFEYRAVLAPAFFLPDIISAIPLLIGFRFDLAVLINAFVWSLILLLLMYRLFKLFQLPNIWALSWALVAFICVYTLILRPTIMQLIFPLFVWFLITLINFLYEPTSLNKARWLAVGTALSFYAYTYLAYIVVLSLGCVCIYYIAIKSYKEFKAIFVAGIYALLMLIPYGIITYFQMKNVYYFETLNRIGMLHTHRPSIEAFFYGRWVVVGLFALFFLWKFFYREDRKEQIENIFWFSTGISLLIASCLNFFTGVEMFLGSHIGRFIVLWIVLLLAVLTYRGYVRRPYKITDYKYLVVAALILILSVGVLNNIPRGVTFFNYNNRGDDTLDIQSYAAPLKWLDENVAEESVVWANDSLSQYIPVMTKHYPLFFFGATLHTMPGAEIEERYLLSRSHINLTPTELKRDFTLYSAKTPMKDDAYFQALAKRVITVKKEQNTLLSKYHVRYFLLDRSRDSVGQFSPKNALYDDGRFVIVPLPLR